MNTLEKIGSPFEIIAVVDGCTDNSAAVISAVNARDPRVKRIEFSRNFGNQMAITAGLSFSIGNTVVVTDDDLENPPELIPSLIAKADEGFDVVYAKRRKREIFLLRNGIFRFYYRIFSKLSNFEVPEDVGDYCLMRRPIVDALNAMPESHRYIRGLRSWAGFKQTGIEYGREGRHSGRSGFNLLEMIDLMYEAGLRAMKVGIESSDEEILRNLKRRVGYRAPGSHDPLCGKKGHRHRGVLHRRVIG